MHARVNCSNDVSTSYASKNEKLARGVPQVLVTPHGLSKQMLVLGRSVISEVSDSVISQSMPRSLLIAHLGQYMWVKNFTDCM